MFRIKSTFQDLKIPQWILLAASLASGLGAAALGVADNPPGIAMMYISLTCLAGAWVWNWPSPREFWSLLMLASIAFPVAVGLHNMLFMLGKLISGIPVLRELVAFLGAFFFLIAVAAVAPTALVALLGGIITSWQGLKRLTRINRSCRRFKENQHIRERTLLRLVELARCSASGANLQPLKYILSTSPERNQEIFPTLSWAGYLKEWSGPGEGERPAGYVIVLGDTELANSFQYDAGIAGQSITLGAAELGLGACLIGSIKRDQLRGALSIPERYEILLVIALGKPAERIVLEDIAEGEDIHYWRDDQDRHHVPKRSMNEILLKRY